MEVLVPYIELSTTVIFGAVWRALCEAVVFRIPRVKVENQFFPFVSLSNMLRFCPGM